MSRLVTLGERLRMDVGVEGMEGKAEVEEEEKLELLLKEEVLA